MVEGTREGSEDVRVKLSLVVPKFDEDETIDPFLQRAERVLADLDSALGEAVIIIDVDLQDPPELIPDLIAKWREGNDVVYAQRTSRGSDTATKRLTTS